MRNYQQKGQYLEVNRVWYQHQDSIAWLEPADVVCHQENMVWLYNIGNMQKVAACKVKPYEVVSREEDKDISDDKGAENVVDIENREEANAIMENLKN